MKTFITIIITLVVAIVIALGIRAYIHKKSDSQKELTVRIEKPLFGTLIESVNAPGDVKPKRKVDISAKISARIVELPFEEGMRATKGNPEQGIKPSILVKLDDSDLQASLKSAKAYRNAQIAQIEVEKTRIKSLEATAQKTISLLKQAERELQRLTTLLETRDVSQSNVDDAQSTVEQLQAALEAEKNNIMAAQMALNVTKHNLEAADAEADRAEQRLTYTTIMAPMDGIVTKVNAEVGEIAMTGTMNNPGTIILQVADLSQMLLLARVDEADVAEIEAGQQAAVHIHAWPDKPIKGVVEKKALTLSSRSETKYAEVEILLEKTERQLYSGLTADVDIEVKKHQAIIKLPTQSIIGKEIDSLPLEIRENTPLVDSKKLYTTVVYRFVDGLGLVTPVKTGSSDATHTVILEGITKDDLIIVGPCKTLESMKHQQKVKDEKDDEKDDKKV